MQLQVFQAESTLSTLAGRTCPQVHAGSLQAPLLLPECLDTSGADIIIQSSDYTNFPIHKSILASSSQFFKDMFSLPQPSNAVVNGLPVVHVSEDAELVRALITVLYPIPPKIPTSYDRVLALLAAAQKYDMSTVKSSIRTEVRRKNLLAADGTALFVYAVASKNRLLMESETAARLALNHPLTFEFIGQGLRLFEGRALSDLASFRKSCRDSVVSCLESFLDIRNGPSKIWTPCSKSKVPSRYQSGSSFCLGPSLGRPTGDDPALPSWLHGLFTQQSFTNSLLKPSSIREKYLEALHVHIRQSDECTSCLMTHTLQGEKYCVKLEQKLACALDKASGKFRVDFSGDFLTSSICR
jgi:hypothetical protein